MESCRHILQQKLFTIAIGLIRTSWNENSFGWSIHAPSCTMFACNILVLERGFSSLRGHCGLLESLTGGCTTRREIVPRREANSLIKVSSLDIHYLAPMLTIFQGSYKYVPVTFTPRNDSRLYSSTVNFAPSLLLRINRATGLI